jgi:hypothetical protein
MGIVKSMFAATRLVHGRQSGTGSNFYALRAIFKAFFAAAAASHAVPHTAALWGCTSCLYLAGALFYHMQLPHN